MTRNGNNENVRYLEVARTYLYIIIFFFPKERELGSLGLPLCNSGGWKTVCWCLQTIKGRGPEVLYIPSQDVSEVPLQKKAIFKHVRAQNVY